MARNHQVLGVNNAVTSVIRQEELKSQFPPERRLNDRVIELPREQATDHPLTPTLSPEGGEGVSFEEPRTLLLPEPAHPELGKLGVFWHTQGSGKSYSMAFFTEKMRRQIPGNFTFLLMTDRDDLDGQIYRTFACWKNCWARITKSSPPMIGWITQTQAEVEVFILDRLYSLLPSPKFSVSVYSHPKLLSHRE